VSHPTPRWRAPHEAGGPAPTPRIHVRQGDLLLVAIDPDELPATTVTVPRRQGRIVLAEGEATGHAHVVRAPGARLLEARPEEDRVEAGVAGRAGTFPAARFLVVPVPFELTHEEHAAIALPGGAYRVVLQREYLPAELEASRWQTVRD
jgi:hypothetical protein